MSLGKNFNYRWILLTGIFLPILSLNFLLPFAATAQENKQELTSPEISLTPDDRIIILAPHPDDEVLGCGGIIQKSLSMKLPLKVVFLTYGDNNQWSFLVYRKHPVIKPKAVRIMGETRREEALHAGKFLGLTPQQMIFLGYPDFRTLTLWRRHWGDDRPAAKSMLSRVNAVPYSNAFRPGAPYKGDEIVKDLKNILREFNPTKVFLSHPADHNPDHRALYLFTQIALWELEDEIKPTLYPYLIHFKNWPKLKGYKPQAALMPPAALNKEIRWSVVALTTQEIENNRNAIMAHRSQYISNSKYLLSFLRRNELYGDFPQILLKERGIKNSLVQHAQDYLNELPEELIEEERVDFVGIEEEFLSLENKTLVFTLRLSRPIGSKITASLYVFGYRADSPFSNMPKLHVLLKTESYRVYDQGKSLKAEIIEVDRKSREITIRIPLETLGNPKRILTSVRTYRGRVPLDWIEWRILRLDHTGD
jgi:LmbE family N-acetylglucosaminyl deacetylase